MMFGIRCRLSLVKDLVVAVLPVSIVRLGERDGGGWDLKLGGGPRSRIGMVVVPLEHERARRRFPRQYVARVVSFDS